MREILFRGKRLDNGERVEGFYSFTNRGGDRHFIYSEPDELKSHTFDYFRVDPSTIGEYTSVNKGERKLFEGDGGIDEEHGRYYIKHGRFEAKGMGGGHVGFYVCFPNEPDYAITVRKDLVYWADKLAFDMNVHDNPELLEVSP